MKGQTTILFVDDEPGIRTTLPAILTSFGFSVTSAATVPEALNLIANREFDVLISDLNIGHPADGFTVVSAMRRTQPDAITFILTGYPAFESALEAIRRQVDDYLVKPTEIGALVENIRQKLANPKTAIRHAKPKRLADILEENKPQIIQQWLSAAKQDAKLAAVKLSDQERVDHLAIMTDEMIAKSRGNDISKAGLEAAASHGKTRFEQGYSIPLILREAAILQDVVSRCIQENLLQADISFVIPDMIRIGETLQSLLEESIREYSNAGESTAGRAAPARAQSLLLLSVDRELALLRERVLELAGFAVTAPQGRKDALRALKEKKFDALVITYSMSSKNAVEMRKLFQEQNPNAPTIGIVKEKWQDLKPHIDFAVSGDEGPDGLIEALHTAINRKQLRRVK